VCLIGDVVILLEFIDGYVVDVWVFIFYYFVDGCEYFVFGFGDWVSLCVLWVEELLFVWLYSECLIGDVFGS